MEREPRETGLQRMAAWLNAARVVESCLTETATDLSQACKRTHRDQRDIDPAFEMSVETLLAGAGIKFFGCWRLR